MTTDNSISSVEVDDWFEQESYDDALQSALPVDPAEKYAQSQLRVVRETKDYQLDYLRYTLQPGHETFNIYPSYQRRLRWSNKKKSLLIESFLLNIPVPPIFLFETDYNQYEVIDGRQRLEAVSSFLSNEYALSGLEYWPELNRKRFAALPQILQRGLLRRTLSAVVLLAETKSSADEEIDVRRVLFDRLNTGGVTLNPQELRNALYPGSLNELLIKLARSEPFTTAWNIPPYTPGEESEPPERLEKNPLFSSLADAELVLRFFALRDALRSDRQGSLRRILDRYMEVNANLDKNTAKEMQAEFTRLLERLISIFGDDPFALPTTGRKSRPLYDALMIALSDHSDLNPKPASVDIRRALALALNDEHKYDTLVGRGNTISSIKERVELAGRILRGEVD